MAEIRSPIGCGEEEAIRFLGCTENLFKDLRAAKIIKPLRKGWYSYRLLEEAQRFIEDQLSDNVIELYATKDPGSVPVQREVGSVGSAPSDAPSKDVLAQLKRRRK